MNRNVPIIPTVIFLLLLLNTIFIYANKTTDILPTPVQQVVQSSDGTIWGLIGDSFVDLSDKKPDLSFSQHGFEYHVGQALALRSGEWILNVGAQGDYVKKAIVRSAIDAHNEYQSRGSLLKCSADLSVCKSWGEAELQFERAFDGFELQDGKLLLFKAEKKRVFLVDEYGFVLDQLAEREFWFGVQRSSDGTIFGLETNHRKLEQVLLSDGRLKVETLTLSFDDTTGDADQILSPSKVVEHLGNYWLLGSPLSQAITGDLEPIKRRIDLSPSLLSVNAQSGAVTVLSYSFRADAEIEKIGDNIYFSDFNKYELKRFNLSSQTMALVESDHLQNAFDRDQSRIEAGRSSLYRVLTINVVGVLLALIWLLWESKPTREVGEE